MRATTVLLHDFSAHLKYFCKSLLLLGHEGPADLGRCNCVC
jgi:hypothetical protein